MKKALGILAVLIAAGAAARADEVTLKSGGKVTGIATERDGRVVVEMGVGTVEFNADEVLTLQRGRTPLHDYRERAARLSENATAAQHYELAVFARNNGMAGHAREQFERVLVLEPGHEGARRALGFRLYQGQWRTESEINREMGLVQFEGRWVSATEVELVRQRRLEREERTLAENAERARKREEERERRAVLMRLTYERAAERARERERAADVDRYGGDFGSGRWGGVYDVVPYVNIYDLIQRVPFRGIPQFVSP